MVCLAPRAPRDSVRPRRLSDVVVRPLNFTVRRQQSVAEQSPTNPNRQRLRSELSGATLAPLSNSRG